MNESFDHLAPECREEACFSAETRIRATLTERWIAYPRTALALERLNHLLSYPPRDRMPCLLLYGATGMGKTKILRKFIRDHPTSFNAKTGINAVPLVAIQMPPEPDEKALYLQLLHALHAPTRHRHPTSQLRQIVGDLLKFTNTRMLLIDEVHSLLAGTYRQQRILLNTLRYLANELQLPLVCAGTSEAKHALLTDQQLADRFEAIELPVWQNDANLTRLLASFQAILPLRKPSELTKVEVRQEILRRTGGVTVRMVRLIEALAVEAIRSGRESIQLPDFSALDAQAPLLSMESLALF